MYADLSDQYYTRWVSDNDSGLTNKNLAFAWELMRIKNFDRIVFYDREDRVSVMEFIKWARDPKKLLFEQFRRDGTPISLCWLTDPSLTCKQAFSHFTTFDIVPREEALERGRLVIKLIGKITKIKQFIGITPKCFRHAIPFAYDLGFKYLTTLKGAVYCRGKERDAVLSICETQE